MLFFLWLYWLLLVSMVVVCCLVWCLFLVVWVMIDGVLKFFWMLCICDSRVYFHAFMAAMLVG